jgi:DNA invertase Pin-like site-specific DNA recombinase
MNDRVLGYIRVSTDEQADSRAGLDAQRAAILAEATRRGWQLVEVIEDAGYSGKSLRRPGIQAALEALRTRRADTLVVAKLDRLSRSLLDFAGLMNQATRERWALVALDLGVDTTSPAGEAMANVLATFAQFERRLIGERTREALMAKKASGVRLGRPAQLPADVARRIRRDRSQGRSLREIAAQLDAEGVPTAQGGRRWYASTVRAVLHRTEA